MVFSFDSLGGWALFAAALFTWTSSRSLRSGTRINLRFAAAMLGTFAASLLVPQSALAAPVGWLSGSLAATALFLAFAFPESAPIWLSSFLLSAAFVFGLAGAFVLPAAGFLGQAAAGIALLAAGLARFHHDPQRRPLLALLGAVSLLCASLALMDGNAYAAFFFAAGLGLLARSLQNPIIELELKRDLLIGKSGL